MKRAYLASANQHNRKMPQGNLYNTLLNNVVELRFVRRRPVKGLSNTRRMLCTNCSHILNSINGRMVLNYRAPSSLPAYDPTQLGLIITWDILMQDFRQVSQETCSIIKVIPGTDEFWKYFNEQIITMTTYQKVAFMNS